MKEIVYNIAVFAVIAFAISGFTACIGDAGDVASSSTNSAGNKDASEYPPLESSLATAQFETQDGTSFTVEQRRGKVLLLNLWGIWCVPCRQEMPHLVEIQDKYREKGFQIIGLNIGDEDLEPESFERINAFAEELKLNYELVRISNETATEFSKVAKFDGVPLSILVDREGRMRGVFKGGSPSEVRKLKELVEKVVME